jgi:hypothetical protein
MDALLPWWQCPGHVSCDCRCRHSNTHNASWHVTAAISRSGNPHSLPAAHSTHNRQHASNMLYAITASMSYVIAPHVAWVNPPPIGIQLKFYPTMHAQQIAEDGPGSLALATAVLHQRHEHSTCSDTTAAASALTWSTFRSFIRNL